MRDERLPKGPQFASESLDADTGSGTDLKLYHYPRAEKRAPLRLTVYNKNVSSDFALHKMAEADFPTRWGHFRIMGFEGHFDPGSAADRRKEEAVALVLGDIHAAPPLVRIHSQCLTEMFSDHCAAIAASNWRWRSRLLPRREQACCSMRCRKAAASG